MLKLTVNVDGDKEIVEYHNNNDSAYTRAEGLTKKLGSRVKSIQFQPVKKHLELVSTTEVTQSQYVEVK